MPRQDIEIAVNYCVKIFNSIKNFIESCYLSSQEHTLTVQLYFFLQDHMNGILCTWFIQLAEVNLLRIYMIQSLYLIIIIKFLPSPGLNIMFIYRMYAFSQLDVVAIHKQLSIVHALTPLATFHCHYMLCPCFILPGKGNCRNLVTNRISHWKYFCMRKLKILIPLFTKKENERVQKAINKKADCYFSQRTFYQ